MCKESFKKNKKGITLIALVVTIIIIMILAGVSINLLLGQYGVVTRAKDTSKLQEEALLNEEIALNELDDQMDKILENKVATIEELKEEGTYTKSETTAKDSDENLIKIPKGFKIAEDSGISVTEGIIIEDDDITVDGAQKSRGNQYVWIPVGKGIKKNNNTTVDITLGRYTFANGTSDMADDGENLLAKGTPILVQDIKNYTEQIVINNYYYEYSTQRDGIASNATDGLNATALSIENFKTSVEKNGGYYIARYEASYGTDKKANSKISIETNADGQKGDVEGCIWIRVTQLDAAKACKNLYSTGVTSDLINSYAWDTAIVYIQKFSEDTEYSMRTSEDFENFAVMSNTGVNGDEICKINDMATNKYEWTTEYSTSKSYAYAWPSTYRGGYNYNKDKYAGERHSSKASVYSDQHTGFRTILYINN